MVILFLAGFLGVALFVLLARYAPPILRQRIAGASDRRSAIPPPALRALAVDLLSALGLTVVDAESDERHLVASKREPFGEIRQVVVLAPAPSGGVVDQATVVALAEDVKAEHAARGMLITPGKISTAGLAGLETPLELVDGARFRELISQHLPSRLGELDRYRGFARPASP